MTDKPTPTDAEILDAAEDFRSQYTHGGTTFDEFDEIGFARAVLAKWGQPAQAQAQAGAVPLTDEQIKALMRAHRTAMLMTCKAQVPECGEFSAIAQDLDWLCESLGIKGGQHGAK